MFFCIVGIAASCLAVFVSVYVVFAILYELIYNDRWGSY